MSPTEYKQRHPLAWFVIGGVLLFAGVAAASLNGWLPLGGQQAVAVCNECGVIEAVRTVETPMAPDTLDPAAAAAQVSVSYETTVRYDNGTMGVFSQAEPPPWAPGDKVKVVDGLILVAG